MILPIYAYGHPILRKETEEVGPEFPDLKQYIADLWETMYHSEGVGLASPQVGRNLRIFVVDTEQMNDEETAPEDREPNPIKKVFINPIIIDETGDEIAMAEGCLSIPHVRESVTRHDTVRIEYYDENFQLHEETYTDFTARVIQHEYDHIEGVLFTDKLKPLKKKMINKKLKKIAAGEVRTNYVMRFHK